MNDKIINFLLLAKKKTYAGKGAEEKPSRLKSHDLKYADGDLMYYDSYIGNDFFSGEEALWMDENPIWSMNYIGRVLDVSTFSGDFLKESLLLVNKDYPYRGPLYHKNEDYEYEMEVKGNFNWFIGSERILYKGKIIYECNFHGGIVKERKL